MIIWKIKVKGMFWFGTRKLVYFSGHKLVNIEIVINYCFGYRISLQRLFASENRWCFLWSVCKHICDIRWPRLFQLFSSFFDSSSFSGFPDKHPPSILCRLRLRCLLLGIILIASLKIISLWLLPSFKILFLKRSDSDT